MKPSLKTISAVTLVAAFVLGLSGPALADDPTLEKAGYLFSQGDYGAAAREYRRVLKADPREPYAYLGLAMALKSKGSLDEAQGVLRELLTLHPNFAPGYYNLGSVLEARGDVEGAKQAYREFIRLSGRQLPDDPEMRVKFRKLGLL